MQRLSRPSISPYPTPSGDLPLVDAPGDTIDVRQEAFEELRAQWEATWAAMFHSISVHREAQEKLLARLAPSAGCIVAALAEKRGLNGEATEKRRPTETIQFSRPAAETQPNHRRIPTESTSVVAAAMSNLNSDMEEHRLEEAMMRVALAGSSVDLEMDATSMLDRIKTKTAKTLMGRIVLEFRRRCLQMSIWFLRLQEPERVGPVANLIQTSFWSGMVNSVILANAIFMVFSEDYAAAHVESQAELPMAMQIAELIFIAFFAVELAVKFAVHRLYLFCMQDGGWHCFDAFLVLISAYDLFYQLVSANDGGDASNFTFLRALRVLRIARSLRVIRVLRFAAQLRRIIQSVLGSFVSLFWSFCMLLFVFYLFGIATVQSVTASLPTVTVGVDIDDASYDTLKECFGSVAGSILTYYKATSGGDDWSKYYEVLAVVSPIGAFIFLFVIGFTQAQEQRREDLKDARELRRFLADVLHVDCSGDLTWEDFSRIAEDARAQAVFSILGLEIRNPKLFYDVVRCYQDDDSESFDAFLQSCMRMKGKASTLDVHALLYKTQKLDDEVSRLAASCALRT